MIKISTRTSRKLLQILQKDLEQYQAKKDAVCARLKAVNPMSDDYLKLHSDRRFWECKIQAVKDRIHRAESHTPSPSMDSYHLPINASK